MDLVDRAPQLVRRPRRADGSGAEGGVVSRLPHDARLR